MSKEHSIGKTSVIIALIGNSVAGISKFVAFFFSGSSVMLSEGIHSITDVTNQVFLLIGINRSKKPADDDFNYGYRGERFFWSLLSACCVFFFGAGVTLYHAANSFVHQESIEVNAFTLSVLAVSLLVEGIALRSAVKELKRHAGNESLLKYARHSGDPTLLAIIYEDSAAIFGILIALISMILVKLTGNHFWDVIGSAFIGLLLGFVAVSLMNINRKLLIGRSIPQHVRKKIFTVLLNQPVVEEVHDFKTVMMATDGYRVKAEVEVDGHYLAEKIFSTRDFKKEYEDIKNYHDFVKFCVMYSDEVTRTLGREIDELEKEIEEEVPMVRHIDIEAN